MPSSSVASKNLDRVAAQRELDPESREFCLNLVRAGTEEHALRAIAILAAAGYAVPTLSPTVRSGKWPSLPRRENELEAIYKVVHDDRDILHSYITALLAKAGPAEKVRENFFFRFVEQQPGSTLLAQIAAGIEVVAGHLHRLDTNRAEFRKRLFKIANQALKKARGGLNLEGDIGVFEGLGKLLRIGSKPEASEASNILIMLLDQIQKLDPNDRMTKFQSIWGALGKPADLLHIGWSPKLIKKNERLRRFLFTNEVIAYSCRAKGKDAQEAARSLLFLVLPDAESVDEWISDARACLALIGQAKEEAGDFSQLAQAIQEAGIETPVKISLFQDLSGATASELVRLIRAYDSEIRRLQRDVLHLQDERTIRTRAGDLIREEVNRQTEVLQKFVTHAADTRSQLAGQLRAMIAEVRKEPTVEKLQKLERVILDAVAHLESKT
jgi:hypothetical protein